MKPLSYSHLMGAIQEDNPPRVATANADLEGYVQQLIQPLMGSMPPEAVERFRLESLDHLEWTVEKYCQDGMSVEEATKLALEEFGSAEFGSEDFLNAWFENQAKSPLVRRFGHGTVIAFCYFGVAEMIFTFFLLFRTYLPSTAAYQTPWDPVLVRRFLPEPLPYPELSWQFLALVLYPVIAPLVAGWLSGKQIPTRAGHAAYQALMPLVLYSFVVGTLIAPTNEALLYALFQVAFWLPMGCLTAHLSSLFARSWRCRRTTRSRAQVAHR